MNETLTAAAWSLMYIPNWALITVAIIGIGLIATTGYIAVRFIRNHSRKLA